MKLRRVACSRVARGVTSIPSYAAPKRPVFGANSNLPSFSVKNLPDGLK